MKKKRKQRDGKVPSSRNINRCALVVSLACIALLAWTLAKNSNGPESAPPLKPAAGEPQLPPSPRLTILDGTWQIAGADWKFAVRSVSERDVDGAIEHPPVGWQGPASTDAEHLAVAALLKTRLPSHFNRSGKSVHGLDSATLKLRLFTAESAGVLGGYLAVPREADWRVVSITPAEASRGNGQDADLLPLPDGTRRICTRYDEQARPQCNVVTVFHHVTDLAAAWRSEGWSVEQPDWAQLHGHILFCSRDREFVQVTVQPGNPLGGTVLILSDNSTLTKPATNIALRSDERDELSPRKRRQHLDQDAG